MTTQAPILLASRRRLPWLAFADSGDAGKAFVDGSGWSRDLTPIERDRVLASVRVVTYRRGEPITVTGLLAEYWMGVLEGLVVQSVCARGGHSVFLFSVCAGSWFGEDDLIHRGAWRYDAVAMDLTKVVLLPATVFHRLRGTSIAFNHSLQASLNERLAFCADLALIRTADSTERVAGILHKLAMSQSKQSGRTHLRISQAGLGQLAGLSRQRTNKALRELSLRGLISVSRGGITIVDLEELGARQQLPAGPGAL